MIFDQIEIDTLDKNNTININHYHMFMFFYKNSFIKHIFMLLFIGVGGLTCATIVVSMFLYNDYKILKINNPDYDASDTDASDTDASDTDSADSSYDYENKYIDKYEELISRNIEDNELDTFKYIFVSNKTPKGLIKMYYDKILNSFCYYADSKDISYKYLETVGRFYVIEHDCKSLLINSKEEYNKAIETQQAILLKKEQEKKLEKELEKEDKLTNNSIFARFKSYNTTTNIGPNSVTNTMTNSGVITNNNIPIIPEKSNHYIYKGKLSDYEEYMNTNKNSFDNIDNDYEHLDYAAFKKLEENKKSV